MKMFLLAFLIFGLASMGFAQVLGQSWEKCIGFDRDQAECAFIAASETQSPRTIKLGSRKNKGTGYTGCFDPSAVGEGASGGAVQVRFCADLAANVDGDTNLCEAVHYHPTLGAPTLDGDADAGTRCIHNLNPGVYMVEIVTSCTVDCIFQFSEE